MNRYSLINAQPKDFEFLKNVHHTTLKEHITKIWGWDKTQQDQIFKQEFESGNIQVVSFAQKNIGYLQLKIEMDSIHLINILILSEFQGQGLGTEIMHDLIAKSKTENVTLKLGVFKINTGAKRLYEKLGFKTYSESDTHFYMRYNSGAG